MNLQVVYQTCSPFRAAIFLRNIILWPVLDMPQHVQKLSSMVATSIPGANFTNFTWWEVWHKVPKSTVHTKSVSRPRGCRQQNVKTRKRVNARNMCKQDDWTCESTKMRKHENLKSAKTRKRHKKKMHENAEDVKAQQREKTKMRKRFSRFLVFSFWWLHLSGQVAVLTCLAD